MVEKPPTSAMGPDECDALASTRSAAAAGLRSPARRADVPTFAPGERLAGRYRIARLLGRGGMGEVYEARDEELSIPVALKVLRWEVGREREALWRLKREVLLARAVAHPHVCRVYDLGRHGDGPDALWFLTMELLRGETLRERLRQRGRLAPEEALPLAEHMAAGLGAAHRAGVVHRDFKSANVMLVGSAGEERAVVTDFGVARATGAIIEEEGERTASGVLLGTLAYMAPEQLRGEEAGPAADIHALGVVLYELVTGRLPFEGKRALEIATRRLLEEAPSPRSVVTDLDERWEKVILCCLSRDPRSRFGRAEEVAEALLGRTPISGVAARVSALRTQHTLPAERDAFVGREVDLEELERKLGAGARLVTLLGAAGMGKTRLAVRYGWQSLGSWSGGVWFCDLTEARSPDGIASAVATALGVPLGREDPIEQLGHAIAGRGPSLVILDNFEQVVGQAGESVGRWLTRAEEARFVVTSRERLNLRGEEVQGVEPLSVASGVELFVERARRQRPGFEVAGTELESVREVVRLVEGMPLAIELAAARLRLMTPAQLVERMRERFRLLRGTGGGRHATLEAAIEGSWVLLRPWEKAALAQCAVFEGGFTLEAAEAVLDLGAWPEAPWVVDVVQSLLDKSLLRTWVPEEAVGTVLPQVRFGMYVSLQEYARNKLKEEGAVPRKGIDDQAAPTAEERHGRWFASYGTDDAIYALDRHGGVGRRRALGHDLENLIMACRRAVARRDDDIAAATYRAAWTVFDLRGPYLAAVTLGQEVLGEPLRLEERALVLMTLGRAERNAGQMEEARVHLEAALAIHREMGDRRSEGIVLCDLGTLHHEQGREEEARTDLEAALAIHREMGDRRAEGIDLGCLGTLHLEQGRMEEARPQYEAALAIYRELGNRRSEGIVLGNLGILHFYQSRMEEARSHYEAALAIHREINDRRSEGIMLGTLGGMHLVQGRMEEARAHYEAALAIHREVGRRRFEGVVLGHLGAVHHNQGRMEEARAHFEAALAIHREVGHRRFEGIVLADLANLHLEQGRMQDARALYEEALAIDREVGNRRSEGVALANLGYIHLEEGRMEDARDALARGEALIREVGDQFGLGKLLCVRAELEHRGGDIAAARATLGEAEALTAQVAAGPDSELGRQLAKLRQTLAPRTHHDIERDEVHERLL